MEKYNIIKEQQTLKKLIEISKKEKLKYRKKLTINQNITFGVELEYEKGMYDAVEVIDQYMYYPDPTTTRENNGYLYGGEIISPVLKNKVEHFYNLGNQIQYIKDGEGVIGTHSSTHIHLGYDYLQDSPNAWKNLFLFWGAYEDILYRFLAGEFESWRYDMESQALQSAWIIEEALKSTSTLEELISFYHHYAQKTSGLVVKNYKNKNELKPTIEIRVPNGSLNIRVIQNNINTLGHLLELSKTTNYNQNKEKYQHYLNKTSGKTYYDYLELYPTKAEELMNLLFKDDLDKIYFLKQYLKKEPPFNKKFKTRKKGVRNVYNY